MIKSLLIATALAGLIGAAPAIAAQDCFSKAEFEADQALRVHTELMVIGLKCHKTYHDQDPFGHYAEFTHANAGPLRQWERTMVGHFQKVGGGNATKRFDTYRTELANETSQRSLMIPAADYCATQIQRLLEVTSLKSADFKRMINDVKGEPVSTRPMCGKATQVAAVPTRVETMRAPLAHPSPTHKPAHKAPTK
ncbi:MAG: hypothetical protein GC191_11110 [Azospirillum sp.]|nr:hypothetical protein [Azospirillum sp.]